MALPIRARLTLWYSGVLALILVALGSFLVLRLRSDLLRGLDSTLATRAQQIALAVTGTGEGEFQDVGDAPSLAGVPRGDAVAQILAPDGQVLQTSGEAEIEAPLLGRPAVRKAMDGSYRATVAVGGGREPYRVLAVGLPRRSRLLVVAASTDPIDVAVRRLILLLATAGPATIGLCGAGGYLLARRALRPIDRMTRAASAIGADDPSGRLDVPRLHDEVGRLGHTLNQMLARLQSGLEEQRRFVADASHELRTPLSLMAGEIDVDLRSSATPAESRATLESLREEVTRMTALVDDLLMLASIDEGAGRPMPSKVDLLALSRDVVARFASRAQRYGIALSVDGDPVVVWGDEGRLSRVVSNLLDNALKHTPAAGTVSVSVGRGAGSATVSVIDSGVGIAREDLPHIFDRFYRVDKARTRSDGGAGLGLAVCESIVRAHGGTIAMDSTVGEGTAVTIRLRADEPS